MSRTGKTCEKERSVHGTSRRPDQKAFFEKKGLICLSLTKRWKYCYIMAFPKETPNPTAHRLLDTFGSFAKVLDAPVEELEKVNQLVRTLSC